MGTLRRWFVIGVATLMLGALTMATASAVPGGAKLEFFASGLDDEVMSIVFAPGDDRMFIVERPGLIKVIMPDGTVLPTPLLDIRASVFATNGMVFNPEFQSNGLFYVYAIEAGLTRILEYQVSAANPNVADLSTRRVVLERQRDENFHAGGQMAFGPDGYLYMSLGDGGEPPGDPWENGQDITTIDATIIRIDHQTGLGAPDNPFVGAPGDDAIWVYGLRHPWRFSFDEVTGLMYVGDVGSGSIEEINIIAPSQAGSNYGWDVMEGTRCFEAPQGNEPPCGDPAYTMPNLEYTHANGCAVIGGYVYHGTQIPELQNQYIYGDYCEGWVRTFEFVGGAVTNEQDWTSLLGAVPLLTSFGQDNAGELSLAVNGTIYKLVPDGPPPAVGTIAGTVWADDNLDGLQTGEAGLPGISVELWIDSNADGSADLQLDTTTTNASGDYAFTDLAITTAYVIRVDSPVGRMLTLQNVGGNDTIDSDPDPVSGYTSTITLAADEVNDTVDAGLIPAPVGTISGRIWSDTDADGLQDAGEPGFPGLFAWLYTDDDVNGSPDTKIDSYAVDPDGSYLFNVDPAHTYFVRYGKQIFNNGQLTLNLPNRTEWSPQDVGGDDTIDSDANPATGFAGPITVVDGETNDTVDAGFAPLPAAYSEVVSDDGATGYWRLGEATGTTAFDSAGTADATYVGNPGLDSAPLIVDEDQATIFDGVNDVVELVNSATMNQGGPYATKTIELWFNATDVTTRQTLYEQGSITRGLNLYLDGGRLWAGIYNTDTFGGGTPWGPIFLSSPISPNTTYHAAMVFDQPTNSLRLYVNGTEVASGSGVGLLYNHGLSAIGAQRDWARYHTGANQGDVNHFGGTIDEVAIYPTALDSFTLSGHYSLGSEGAATDPTAAIVDPAPGAIVSGLTTVVIEAADDDPEGSLTAAVSNDGGTTWSPAAWNPGSLRYEYDWNTTLQPNGPGTIDARVTDSDGNTALALPIAVTISNAGGVNYHDAVVADGASIYWRLSDTGGTTVTDEFGGNAATYLGSPTFAAPPLIADADPAVDFDGIVDTIHLTNSTEINQGGPYFTKTIELWFNADAVTGRQTLIEQGSVSRGLSMYIDNGLLWAGIYNTDTFGGGTPWGPVFLSSPITANTSYHAVMVFDQPNDTFSLYVNGVAVDSGGGLGGLYNHGRSAIGSQWDWARYHDGARFGDLFYFNGTLDEVAVYPAALGAAAISNHYNAGTNSGSIAPTATISAPNAGTTVSATELVQVSATDDDPAGSLLVEVSTDGGTVWSPAPWNSGALRYEYMWDTTLVTDGPATIDARATDSDVNTTQAPQVAVTVDNAATPDYSAEVIADGASIYWRLGESAGTTMNDEVGTNDNLYLGSAALGSPALIADSDTAVGFDGIDDTVHLINSVELNQGGPYVAKTIELWFNATEVATRQVLLEQGSVTRGLNIYLIDGQLWAGAYNTDTFGGGTPWGPVFVAAPVSAGTVNHVVVVLDAGSDTFSLYLNGVLAGSDNGIGGLYNHGRSAIGSQWDWARFHDGARFGDQYFFAGTLDEIAVYPTALNGSAIAAHFAAGTG